ncbi:MAG: hypothetical protein NTZ95_01425 [Candidatus Omnitrophica bacterium]|nr:hypothetical protein [Candidatus Omnitrophota bacterium]
MTIVIAILLILILMFLVYSRPMRSRDGFVMEMLGKIGGVMPKERRKERRIWERRKRYL